MNRSSLLPVLLTVTAAMGQNVDVTTVQSKPLTRTMALTGEFRPWQSVDLHARVAGFVESITVDRGSPVKQGQLLAVLSAPELDAQVAEAEAQALAVKARAAESRARVSIAQSTLDRLRRAAQTTGAVSGQEIAIAEQTLEETRSVLISSEAAGNAAQASVDAVRKLREYLRIEAPFGGVITERYAHPGALAGPGTGPLVKLEQGGRLRLVVAVPESNYSGITRGARIPFKVAAYPDRSFSGVVARMAGALDAKTRTMAIELDVSNPRNELAPGMFADVQWPVKTRGSTLLVLPTAIVTTTERSFVIRIRNGRAEWVDVRRGGRFDALQEVFGNLEDGDTVVLRGTDEIRDGAALSVTARKSG